MLLNKTRLPRFISIIVVMLLFVFGVKTLAPVIDFAKVFKEALSTTGETDEKTNSDKQADNQEDFNKEKILSVNFKLRELISTETAKACFKVYINNYLPTHCFSVVAPPPDLFSVLKS